MVADGMSIDKLVTVDPIGRSVPDMVDVMGNTRNWVNYLSVGNTGSFANIVAVAGGRWGEKPFGFADKFIRSTKDHAQICVSFCKP